VSLAPFGLLGGQEVVSDLTERPGRVEHGFNPPAKSRSGFWNAADC
jgi:hypothetical protein